ncbi:MAG: sugar phosphate nucleotidyltransferase [Clostridia bacterium]|nr:sugar phosphate nucleotidyltransferase [Clostridia bacterium]
MKAVIMAGGKGTRLRPLTCNKPKPMVPLLNKPVMEYAIDLLKRHGITEIAVTLQYLPEAIRDYFGDGSGWGVNLQYFEETTPLGTAGSVKNAEKFLDEPFLVISGDGLTDIDLSAAVAFHQQQAATATLVLTRVETPLEYGVVITDETGKICRFLEKPSWGEVFSDTVNTGIYILEPGIFEYIPEDTFFDFSKDVFPMLLKAGDPLFGYIATGYWCDIGNLAQYRQTQFDMLDGLVDVKIDGQEVRPGIWLGKGAHIENLETEIPGPIYVGKNTHIESGAKVGEYTILGDNNIVRPGASVKRTVVWNHCYLDKEIELRGATFGNQVTVKSNAAVFEGSVVGDGCSLGARSILKPNVKVWPGKEIEESTTVHTSLVWGEKLSRNIFGQTGVSGIANVDITPDFAAKLAAAYGATLHQGAQIVISADEHPFTQVIKRSLVAGLLSAGVETMDLGESVTPVTRFAVQTMKADGGLHIRLVPPNENKRVLIEFLDSDGINIDKHMERKIENAFVQEDFRRANLEAVQDGKFLPRLKDSYVFRLLEKVANDAIKSYKPKVVLEVENGVLMQLATQVLSKLECQLITITATDNSLIDLAKLVKEYKADLGVRLDRNGEQVIFISNDGRIVKEEMLLALLVLINFQMRKEKVIAVPITASEVMEKIAMAWEGQIVRTKANPRALMSATCHHKEFHALFDALYALIITLENLAVNKSSIGQILDAIPDFHLEQAKVQCSWADKGKVMRRLIEDTASLPVELVDGVKVYHKDGWTLVLPDSDEPVFRVLSEASSQEVAKELAVSYAEKIKAYKSQA